MNNNCEYDRDFSLEECFKRIENIYNEICRWDNYQREQYSRLLETFEQSNRRGSYVDNRTKGKALEDLTTFLLNNSGGVFKVLRNIRSSTNEIDNIIGLSERGNILLNYGRIPDYYKKFLGECKNYSKRVNVTYVGKLCSLMLTTECRLGILFSYHGVTGTKWNDGSGLIRKFYLSRENADKRFCLIDFNINDFRSIKSGENLFQIIEAKIDALQFDTDYLNHLSPHPAEETVTC